MVYKELKNIHVSLDHLCSTMDKALDAVKGIESNTLQTNEYMAHLVQNSDVIAYNTAATAYYSKMNAELTDALGYMVAFR